MLKRFAIDQPSMTPALTPGDFVVARRTRRPPRRGDVIVFGSGDDNWHVKRVIGLPGEAVRSEGGTVLIDDQLADDWGVGLSSPHSSITVPAGHVWVLGDRREVSASDSRTIGPVGIESHWWRASWRYWPLRSIGRI